MNKLTYLLGPFNAGSRFPVIPILVFLMVLGNVIPSYAAQDDLADSSTPPFRVAFSERLFTEVNPADAKAAVKVWAEMIPNSKSRTALIKSFKSSKITWSIRSR